MALGIVFMLTGLGFWFYPQYEYRPDMKANLALIGALISFTELLTLKILISIQRRGKTNYKRGIA